MKPITITPGYSEYQQNPAAFDPINILWSCFRLGTPICHLYNQLRPAKPLEVPDLGPNPGVNDCKKPLAKFVMAWKMDLAMPEEDLFSISKIFEDNTNEFVKVSIRPSADGRTLVVMIGWNDFAFNLLLTTSVHDLGH